MIGLAVCSTILSGIIIVIYLIQLFEFSERLRCPKDEYPTPSSSYSSWDSLCSRYHQNRDWHVTIREAEIGVVSSCFLVVAAGIEFFLALVTSMYGCNVCYSGLYSQVSQLDSGYQTWVSASLGYYRILGFVCLFSFLTFKSKCTRNTYLVP